MLMTQLVRRLGRNDVKLIGRDSFLLFMFIFSFVIAALLRYGLPALNTTLLANGVMPGPVIPVSLADLYPLLLADLVLYTGALLVGTIFGFVLLDEKDQHTLRAMLVTPVPLSRYLLYRAGLPAILAALIVLGSMLFINLALVPLWQLILIAAGAGLTAPIISLFFATIAENKVQGFAYSKFVGIAGWTILVGWFVPEPFQWLFGLFPPFWVSKAYWMALEGRGGWWLVLLIGIVVQVGLIAWLMGRFRKVAYR